MKDYGLRARAQNLRHTGGFHSLPYAQTIGERRSKERGSEQRSKINERDMNAVQFFGQYGLQRELHSSFFFTANVMMNGHSSSNDELNAVQILKSANMNVKCELSR